MYNDYLYRTFYLALYADNEKSFGFTLLHVVIIIWLP